MHLTKKQLDPNFRGAIAKTIVVKQYEGKTVVTAYPDMSRIKPTDKQKARRTAFAEAVAYAGNINNDPVKKVAYAAKLPAGRSVFHAALSEYLLTLKQW